MAIAVDMTGAMGFFNRLRASRREKQATASFELLDKVVLGLIALIALSALFGPLIVPDSVYRSDISNALAAPDAMHWLGTDDQGRDVLWRTLAGARSSVLSAVLVVACYSLIGTIVATVATVGGRWVDEVLMRITDIGFALPGLVVALGIAAALGPSLESALVAMIATGWPYTARLLRGIMKETMASPFVDGAIVLGVSRWRLMTRHVLPNSLDVMTVKWAGDIGNTVLVLAGLSFIGVGAQPPSAEWGASVAGARDYLTTAWWAALVPGIAIALTAAAFGLLGDTLAARRDPASRGM
ncbi:MULTISPECIES: ABC transporter permease [Rhodococcus]|uniref:ABC transporter permease n=1 Tax=Rhodococcus globerulus TaxID=33008 RepID=UPI001C577ABC|nr:ABC transporter permease [Rhodococcus globerulus]QXW04972.1 ABC transporter permease [Rhodococcus globerulus]